MNDIKVEEIQEETIQYYAYKFDYYRFIPYDVVRDLIKVWYYASYRKSEILNTLFPPTNEYNRAFNKLVSFLDLEHVLPKTGYEFAFDILKILSPKVNFRTMSDARITGMTFKVKEDEFQTNYAFDTTTLPKELLKQVGLEETVDLTTYVLSEEVETILRFYSGFKKLPGIDDKISNIVRDNMSDYNQILKTNKWRYKSPHFKYDLVKKNLRVKIPKVEYKSKVEVYLLIDQSYSTYQNVEYKALYKAILLHYYLKFVEGLTKLHITLFGHVVYETITITNKAQLIDFVHKQIVPKLDLRGWSEVYSHMNSELQSEDIVLITDGNESNVDTNHQTSNRWTIVSLQENENLNQIAVSTGGKFIVV